MNGASRQKFGWISAVAAMAISATAALGLGPRQVAADPLLDTPFGRVGDCTYQCRKCGGEDEEKHDIVVGTKSNAQSSHLETCNPGTCAAHACDADQLPSGGLGALWFEVREAQDGSRLRELLREHREVAYYNPARDAVQVRGCNGSVMASIPLSDAQVALLEE
jgi:hypothetical protein